MTSYNEERLHYENVAISKIKSDSKYFFRYADKHRKTKKSIGPLDTGKGEFTTSDPKEMCNLLQHQYLKVISNPSLSNRIDDVNSFFMMDNSDIEIPLLDSIKVSSQDVKDAIASMNKHSAAGPDGIPSMLLNQCCENIAEQSMCFNKSIDQGSIPDFLKTAAVVPIHKGGSKSDPANYRAVSLTSVIMKIFEQIMRKAIVEHLDINQLMNKSQHGFRKGRSCISAISNPNVNCIDMVYLDFAKVFDKVDHHILLYKLKQFGITKHVGIWLASFLSDCKQFVQIPGGISTYGPVSSGVPQFSFSY